MLRNNKKILILVLSIALIINTTSVYAWGDWTEGKDYEWAPYISNATAKSYSSNLRAYAKFYFDKEGVDANEFAYFTMEENCGDGQKLDVNSQYSNIPDPHFDTDDDDNDGYYEESEVVKGLYATLNPSSSYYFTTWWDKGGSVSAGQVNFIAQNSVWNPAAQEYEGLIYDYLTSRNYSAIAKSASQIYGNSLKKNLDIKKVNDISIEKKIII